MGLFTKVTCAICGKETRFSKIKLAGGDYICADCSHAMHFHHNDLQGVFERTKIPTGKLTLEEVKSYHEIRKQNLEQLQTFNWTDSLGLEFQIDKNSNQVIFADFFTCDNKKKLLEKNPPVFKMENLAFMHLTFSDVTTSQTVTLKETAQSQAYLILGFEDPVFDVFKVEIGKLKAKEGFFSDKVKGGKKIEKIFDTVLEMKNAAIAKAEADNVLIPANSMDSFWKMLSRAYYMGYVSSKDVKNYLSQYCGKDKNLIREIKKEYNL
jgi:hypothetical protein